VATFMKVHVDDTLKQDANNACHFYKMWTTILITSAKFGS